MKQLFYFILLVAGISSIHSCKDMTDEDGNPLIDLNDSNGFNGPRALVRQVTDVGTIAEYHYSGLLLTKVITEKNSTTNIMWSGDKISQITFNGQIDGNNDGTIDDDSISYTQLFTYGNLGRLTLISENRALYKRTPPVPPSTTPGPYLLSKRTKSIFNLAYSATTGKLDIVDMKSGEDIPGVNFVNQDYTKTWFTYLGDNVSKVERHYGKIIAGVNEAPTEKYGYEFLNYDTQISPYTLLPFAYNISSMLASKYGDVESFILSPNNPKRISITDLTLPVPNPAILSTAYRYDAQTYMTQGFSVNYFYKPL